MRLLNLREKALKEFTKIKNDVQKIAHVMLYNISVI